MMFKVKVVKDIWTEEDEGGKVRFATVQVRNKSSSSCQRYSNLKSSFSQRSETTSTFLDLWRHHSHVCGTAKIQWAVLTWIQGFND